MLVLSPSRQVHCEARPCCARTTSGHTTAPPSKLMNLRRLMSPLSGRAGAKFYSGSDGRAMSALGQKRTHAVQQGMSALHPKADMCSALVHVRYRPIADISLL